MDPKQFGQFIGAERAAKGMTQKELAEKLGVTDKAISKWERGVCLPDVAKFDDIAAALDLTDLEVLRAKRLPPETESEPAGAAPPIMCWRELGWLLLACFLVTFPTFALNILEDREDMPLRIIGLARILQVVLCSAAGVWLALRDARDETRANYRSALHYTLALIAVAAACFFVLGGNLSYYLWETPARLFGISGWSDEADTAMYHVWYQQYLDGAWTPRLLLYLYLTYEIFDLPNLIGVLQAFALYPVAKLLRIRRNQKNEARAEP